MNVPFFTLSRQEPELEAGLREAMLRVLEHQEFVLGEEVSAFEAEMKEFLGGTVETVGVSSGTDAMLLLLMAAGIGPGDAVITVPHTFFSTVSCVHRVGAEVIFCDIAPGSNLIDLDQLEELLTSLPQDGEGRLLSRNGNRVKMIVPVHLFGTCCDMKRLMVLSESFGIELMEDAAQVIGADDPTYSSHQIVKAGTVAPLSYISFYPSKNLGAAGDAGLVICRDPSFAQKARIVRNHGMEQRYYHQVVGGNFRMDGFQAAILRTKLPFLNRWNEQRRANAALYRELLAEEEGRGLLSLPEEPWSKTQLPNHHIFHQYVVRLHRAGHREFRNEVMQALEEEGIGSCIYYPVPLHLQDCFAYLGYDHGSYPESEARAEENLALPIFPQLLSEEIETVATKLKKILRRF